MPIPPNPPFPSNQIMFRSYEDEHNKKRRDSSALRQNVASGNNVQFNGLRSPFNASRHLPPLPTTSEAVTDKPIVLSKSANENTATTAPCMGPCCVTSTASAVATKEHLPFKNYWSATHYDERDGPDSAGRISDFVSVSPTQRRLTYSATEFGEEPQRAINDRGGVQVSSQEFRYGYVEDKAVVNCNRVDVEQAEPTSALTLKPLFYTIPQSRGFIRREIMEPRLPPDPYFRSTSPKSYQTFTTGSVGEICSSTQSHMTIALPISHPHIAASSTPNTMKKLYKATSPSESSPHRGESNAQNHRLRSVHNKPSFLSTSNITLSLILVLEFVLELVLHKQIARVNIALPLSKSVRSSSTVAKHPGPGRKF
ncbi:hypothetical protein BDP27DRAFT_1424655 [Rhodocollybia butyracea]|uniref:Uncharacterized protein n=1 Tax=Rhodocollybia butyracea TaxID=206335 RepID=A0A9P5U597_9AGAR|nr:hypothetical protein BDP27DRAFT_1424655 [Rhodocollybia butyracea]